MAAKKASPSPTAARFVAAIQGVEATEEKASVSYTIYVSPSEAEKIARLQKEGGNLTRQHVLRILLQSGLEQVGDLTGWWRSTS